ncbi:MAG: isoamylase early set domain-containing protein [Anaerolineae bacterium]|nr:isoamylase early set domain-containing protein [Anaerolineae bacterium]
MIRKDPGRTPDVVRVTFELPATVWAESVSLVGDFNGWDPSALPMARGRDHESWRITVELQRGREYQFRYLINGTEWCNDWDADRYVPNPYGGDNSVVVL